MQKYTGNKLTLINLLISHTNKYPKPFTDEKQKFQFGTFKPALNEATEDQVIHAIKCIKSNDWDQSDILMNPKIWK